METEIIELKAAKALADEHCAQIIHYLKATNRDRAHNEESPPRSARRTRSDC